MKITKYEHACFTVEQDGKLLVVDPGTYTTSLGSPENVVAIVVTHEHGDHFDSAALGAIIGHNPDAVIIAPDAITRQLGETLPFKTVGAGDEVTIELFELAFFGGEHAVVHKSIPVIANVGVMINDSIYYPGDSFTEPDKPVEVLALPVSAPWLKMSEVVDFLLAVKAQKAFPTHDALNSEVAEAIVNKMLPGFAQQVGTAYVPLAPGQTLDV